MTWEEYAQRAEAVKSRLYRIAYLYLDGETAAVDAVDEAIYRGFCALGKLRQEMYLETWLTRILMNYCKREGGRRKREAPLEAVEHLGAEDYDGLPLKEALEKLPRQLREVVVLRYFGDYTLEETARILDIPRGTVATRQRRALQLLRLALEEE